MQSRMQHVPTFTHAYDHRAREEYMYNHELNPGRYKLPKPHAAPPDRSAGAGYWVEGVTAEDHAAFSAAAAAAAASAASAAASAAPSGPARKQPKKKKKKVRFAAQRGHVRAAVAQLPKAEVETEAAGAEAMPPTTLAAQVKHDLSGIWSDIRSFDSLPAPTAAGKLRYMIMRGNRALSILGVVGVLLLLACCVVAVVYFRSPSQQQGRVAAATAAAAAAAPTALLGGTAMPPYDDEWTRAFVPRTAANSWAYVAR